MMNTRIFLINLVVFAAPVFIAPLQAATSLDELLQETRTIRAADVQLAESRAAQFNAASAAEQVRLMNGATAQRDERAAAAKTLADGYSNNEIRINELNTQLRDKANELQIGELFGLARQVATDVASVLRQSLITAQIRPNTGEVNRDIFLRQFSESKSIPSPAELERVWLEIQREMTESGKVARFSTDIVQPNGSKTNAQVVRIGPFTAITGNDYLGYLPTLQSLHVLPRQPPGEIIDAAEQLQNATGDYVLTIVDPARGVLLDQYVERPSFGERIELGGEVGYVIITVGVAGAVAFIFQLIYLIIVRLAVWRQLRNLNKPNRNNPLGRVLLAFKGDPKTIEADVDIAELRITEAVLHEVPKLERFQALLRLAVAAGPLLGLIGTVYGMIMTFQSIVESGSSNPKLMAAGIGQAMIATILGLGIAVPLLFANAGLATLSRSLVQILDEQSAGLLAESLEKRRRA